MKQLVLSATIGLLLFGMGTFLGLNSDMPFRADMKAQAGSTTVLLSRDSGRCVDGAFRAQYIESGKVLEGCAKVFPPFVMISLRDGMVAQIPVVVFEKVD